MEKVLLLGFSPDQSAYISEIAGLYGMVMVVEVIKEVWMITSGLITLGYDGINAL